MTQVVIWRACQSRGLTVPLCAWGVAVYDAARGFPAIGTLGVAMSNFESSPYRRGFLLTMLGTLSSRVMGVVRDIATFALLGGGGVMDAFVIAFRIPNLLRRILGEGALASSYIPELAKAQQQSPDHAWRLTTALLVWLSRILVALIVTGEIGCGALLAWGGWSNETTQLLELCALLFPYVGLICIAAQLGATLQTLGRFSAPAFAATMFNVLWLIAAWFVAPRLATTPAARAQVLAGAVLVAGVGQIVFQLLPLWRAGFRWSKPSDETRAALRHVVRNLLPMIVGLAITQINTLFDSLLAWGLSAQADGSAPALTARWGIAGPVHSGGVSALYLGERLYQLPVGLLGISMAMVLYPLLARHAAQHNRPQLASDLMLGVRLVSFLAIPCAIGLVMLAQPLAECGFVRGEFSEASAIRAAGVIACYGWGVPFFCLAPVIVRGFHACGDRSTPIRIGMWAVAINLVLDLTLVWFWAEVGLAAATVVSTFVQVVLLFKSFDRNLQPLAWRECLSSLTKTAIASGSLLILLLGSFVMRDVIAARLGPLGWLASTILVGAAGYWLAARLVKHPELRLITLRAASPPISLGS